MHSIQAGVMNEMTKLLLRRKAAFFLCLTALLPFAGMWMVSQVQTGFGIAAVSVADFPVLMLNLFSTLLLPLVIFMAASDMFPGEQQDNTAKLTLTRPVTRFEIFASKHLALLLYIVLYAAIGLVGSVAASWLLGSGDADFSRLLPSVLAYVAAVVPMAAVGFAAMFVGQWFKNGSGALTVTILLYGLAKLCSLLFPQFMTYSPTAYTGWHSLWIGETISWGSIGAVFSLLLGCCVLSFTAGYYLFDKKQW